MALLAFEGFNDGYDADSGIVKQDYYVAGTSNGSMSITTTAGANGTAGLLAVESTHVVFPVTPSGTTMIVGWRMRAAAGGTNAASTNCVQFMEGSIVHVAVGILDLDNRTLELKRGSTVLDETDPAVWEDTTGAFHYFELKVVFHNSTGSIELRRDEEVLLTLTGQDTINGGTGVIDRVTFGPTQNNANSQHIDDIYIMDGSGSSPYTDYLGDVHVVDLLPNGNGNSSQFDGSDGNSTDNYLLVDDPLNAAPVTSDYVESSTAAEKDSYTFENMPGTLDVIFGVKATMHAQKSTAGTRQGRVFTRISGTNYNGDDEYVPAFGWNGFSHLWVLNPADSAAWEDSDVNGAEFGVEVRG